MRNTNPSRGLRLLSLSCLALAGVLFFLLQATMTPALADDSPPGDSTDGAQGQASGGGGDGCAKKGWRLVNDPDSIVWQDGGDGPNSCGNSANQNRNNWTHREFTDNDGNDHVCDTSGQGLQRCNGEAEWTYKNTPLYSALGNIGANACFRRTDLYGIWYLEDDDDVPSWTNYGQGADGNHRTIAALKDAIDDKSDLTRHELVDSGDRGSPDWWDSRIVKWQGQETYDAYVKYYEAIGQSHAQSIASVREDAKTQLSSTIREVTGGGGPVVFCWYSTITNSGLTCAERLPSGTSWSDWLHPDGIERDTTGVSNCIKRCSVSQGDYPNPLPHAGEFIANANSSLNPRPSGNSDSDIADYCYPPIVVKWHQGAYASQIPGMGATVQDTHGSNTGASQPYAYTTVADDGNQAYNASTKKGNAPNQGQFSGATATRKTKFAEFVDSYCAGSPSCSAEQTSDPNSAAYQQFVAAYNAAVAAQPTEPHATVDLSNGQQKEIARGRVLNVIEYTTYASAQARKILDRYYHRLVTRSRHFGLQGREIDNETTYGDWVYGTAAHDEWKICGSSPCEDVPADMRNTYRDGIQDAHPDKQSWDHGETVYGSTPKATGFWQEATNHCNGQEFATLNPDGTATGPNSEGVIDTGDTSQYYSASAVQKVQNSKYAVSAPAVDFTQARWGATTNNASSKPAFFDRLCYYPGTAAKPTDMSTKTKATQGAFVFFRDGERYTVEGTNGQGDSPFFVPDFRGEDRHSTVTVVDGYKADKSTKTADESWTVSYQESQQTGSSTTPGTAATYSGTWKETWTCTIPKGADGCTPPSGTAKGCQHDSALETGTWGPEATDRDGEKDTVAGGCRYRTYTRTSSTPAQPAQTTYTYGWSGTKTTTYTTDSSATAAYNSCVSKNSAADPGKTRNCSKTHSDAAWSTPTRVSVPSCPQADTATVRYANCAPVTHDEDVVTNYNVVAYDGSDPTQVIVTRDPLGTPNASQAQFFGLTNGGTSTQLFSLNPSDISTPKSQGVYQSQFASSPTFSSSTVAVASGAYKRLQARGVWATDTALPQVLTLAWYFEPSVKSAVPATNVGFGGAGGTMTYTKAQVSTPVRGRVESLANALGTDDGSALAEHQNQVWANSGTNVEDNLNVPLFYGQARDTTAPYKWLMDPSEDNEHYFSVQFRRATQQ